MNGLTARSLNSTHVFHFTPICLSIKVLWGGGGGWAPTSCIIALSHCSNFSIRGEAEDSGYFHEWLTYVLQRGWSGDWQETPTRDQTGYWGGRCQKWQGLGLLGDFPCRTEAHVSGGSSAARLFSLLYMCTIIPLKRAKTSPKNSLPVFYCLLSGNSGGPAALLCCQ